MGTNGRNIQVQMYCKIQWDIKCQELLNPGETKEHEK